VLSFQLLLGFTLAEPTLSVDLFVAIAIKQSFQEKSHTI
jgi:hypothetical protein